jgi:hypothetical protein
MCNTSAADATNKSGIAEDANGDTNDPSGQLTGMGGPGTGGPGTGWGVGTGTGTGTWSNTQRTYIDQSDQAMWISPKSACAQQCDRVAWGGLRSREDQLVKHMWEVLSQLLLLKHDPHQPHDAAFPCSNKYK